MNEIANIRPIELCGDGLNLFPMGSTLPSNILTDLCDIDRSTLDGHMELLLASGNHRSGSASCFYKKLKDGEYHIGGLAVKSILIAYNQFATIQKVVIRLQHYDFISTKLLLDAVYGSASDTKINHKSHQQVSVWSRQGFDVVFWGLSGLIEFYYTSSSKEVKSILYS